MWQSYESLTVTVWRDQNFDRYRDRNFLSETNFSDTNTETFFRRPNFPRPIPRLFFRDQIFQYRYRDFFNETKFFDTDTETFFSRPKLLIPILRLSKNCHGSWDWDRDRDFCIWLTNFRDICRQVLATFAHFLVVSLSVSENLVSDIKSRYRYRKIWSRKKSLGIGIDKFGLVRKVSVSVSENLVS